MSTPLESPQTDRRLGTLTEERVQPSFGDGDHERFAHYVVKDKLTDAIVAGTPVIALCGKVWVPSRDPQRFPVCPECKEIYGQIPHGDGDGEDGSS
ncbi:MAG TPA: DUF3039 domain-containing protein [Actinomycetes bacterium]|jgi:hypothetical protein|nr:DUF3039 domain-containing protein [Actinomycetes bacterium]